MNRLRLVPLLAVSATALLALKVIGLATNGHFVLAGAAPAIAQHADEGGHGAPAAESDGGHGAPAAESGPGVGAQTEQPETPPQDMTPMVPVSDAEREVLESLSERRRQLDARAGELDEREALLQATEARIDERIAELKQLEGQIQATADAQETARSAELQAVVSMYETMKPKDAARIFEGMDLTVLVGLAVKIKPKKLADILAAMSPAAAQQLTVELATRGTRSALPDVNQLPKIGQDIGQAQ